MDVVCTGLTMNCHRELNNQQSVLQHILQKDELFDVQEKTSLVFLMCDDAVKALYILTKNISGCDKYNEILPDLIGYLKQTGQEIFNKFLESLILIKNYQILKKIGFNSDNWKVMFQERENIQYINCVRKALLEMCESLTSAELIYLINEIEEDFKAKGSFFSIRKTNPMELSLLYLISEGYISDGTNNKESNLNYLIRHLENMNKHDLAKKLQKVNQTHVDEVEMSIMCPDNDFSEKNYVLNFSPKPFVSSDTGCYKMDKNNMGFCIIVNQRDFREEQCLARGVKLSRRTGTNYDREILKIMFTALGFKIFILENLCSNTLLSNLNNILRRVQKKHSSLVLCILSHGKEGAVYCIDGIPIKVAEIEKMISGDQCPQLLGKPKLIFIQACQGSEFQKAKPCINNQENNDDDDCEMPECDGPSQLTCQQRIPPTADIVTYWATGPGYASPRFEMGTVFVKTLCAVLLKFGHSPNHMDDVVRLVNNQLSQTQFCEENYVTMPVVTHTLTKKLYFPYCPQHRLKAAEMLYMKFLVEALIKRFTFQLGGTMHYLKMKNSTKKNF